MNLTEQHINRNINIHLLIGTPLDTEIKDMFDYLDILLKNCKKYKAKFKPKRIFICSNIYDMEIMYTPIDGYVCIDINLFQKLTDRFDLYNKDTHTIFRCYLKYKWNINEILGTLRSKRTFEYSLDKGDELIEI